MCWVTYKKPTLERKKAKEDIPCYKVFKVRFSWYKSGILTSPFFPEQAWVWNEVYETELQEPFQDGHSPFNKEYKINFGFHSSASSIYKMETFHGNKMWRNDKRTFFASAPHLKEIVCECIIPKGAEYYLNEYDEYVSNQLKVVKEYVLDKHE